VSVWTSRAAWAQALVLAALMCCSSAGVRAQSLEGVDYETAVNLALNANAAHDYKTARMYMEHAHALYPSARTLRGLGIIAYGEGDRIGALRRLEAALAEQTKPLPESMRASVVKLLVDVYGELGRYEVDAPAESALSVDAAPVERDAQGRVLLTRGKHELALGTGADVRKLEVTIMGGELGRLRFPEANQRAAQPSLKVQTALTAPSSRPSRVDQGAQSRRRNPLALGQAQRRRWLLAYAKGPSVRAAPRGRAQSRRLGHGPRRWRDARGGGYVVVEASGRVESSGDCGAGSPESLAPLTLPLLSLASLH
jgi:hypothetical protein